MSEDLVAFLRTCLDEDEAMARSAAEPEEWVELNRQPRPDWYVQYWADPDRAAVIADPESSAYPVVVTVEGMDEKDAEARVGHIARHDPARVLREVAAKRGTLDALLAEGHAALAPGGSTQIYCPADYGTGEPCDCGRDERVGHYLRLLAVPYADHPEYREEWKL